MGIWQILDEICTQRMYNEDSGIGSGVGKATNCYISNSFMSVTRGLKSTSVTKT
jgi:hypothetical protein